MYIRKERSIDTLKLLLGCFFLAAVIFPLLRLAGYFVTADPVAILSKPLVFEAISRSVAVSLCAAVFSVLLAIVSAYCVARCDVRGKNVFHTFLLFPMLIPSLSHGTGLIILLGANGVITRMLGRQEGVYGFWGIVIGSVLYSFPVAYLMLLDILRYEDATSYEAAAVLGIPRLHQLTALTLPYLRKPLINVFFATFTMIVTDYGVPLMVGGTYKTLPVIMYEEVIGRQDFAQGSVLGMILLIPAVLAFFVDLFCRNRSTSAFVRKPFRPQRVPARDIMATVFLAIVSLCVCAPILAFMSITFANRYPRDMSFSLRHIQTAIQRGVPDYLMNSLLIAVCVALIGTILSTGCAYLTARVPSRASRLLHMMSIVSLAIPGIVLGLTYVMFFKGTWFYGTMGILILVNTVHFFSSPYLMMYNSMNKLNGNLEAVGATLGVGRMRLLRDVLLPQTRTTWMEMLSYFFVNSMMTISAVAFLATTSTKPLSLMINQFEAQTMLEASAFVSLLIWLVNLSVKGLIALAARPSPKSVLHKERKNDADKKTI